MINDNYPENFDITIYKNHNIDLSKLTNEQLTKHYKEYGNNEGRLCSKIKNRYDFINLINQDLDILEIGPLCFPCMNHSKPNVKSVDYFSKDELIENYKNDPNIVSNKIINVDYVIKDNKKYADIIDSKFDVCFSSHNIEHVPCLISFLNNISDIIKSNGYFFLAIPDYRYCFDRYRNESNIFEVLNAYYNKVDKPSAISICEMRYLTTHNTSSDHWNNFINNSNQLQMNAKKEFYKTQSEIIINDFDNIVNLMNSNDKYIDSHCWKFTPDSFSYIINILNKTNLIKFNVLRVYPTLKNSHEFYVVLQKK